jgi:hypothetical protein
MESWGVSSEKDDAVKYEHDEITCKIELSVCWDIIPAISTVLAYIIVFRCLALIDDNASSSNKEKA